MADDESGNWFADGGDDAPPQADSAAASGAAAGGDAAPSSQTEGTKDKREVAEDEIFLNLDKLLLFKHWIRPNFQQYRYLDHYRYNYYDDVLDYLDKRQRGLRREIPHPQTWAERTLRTYNSQNNKAESFRRLVEDTKLVTETKISGAFHLYHSKNYINRRYSSILV